MKRKMNKVKYIKDISRRILSIKPSYRINSKKIYERHKQKLTILPAWYYKEENIE